MSRAAKSPAQPSILRLRRGTSKVELSGIEPESSQPCHLRSTCVVPVLVPERFGQGRPHAFRSPRSDLAQHWSGDTRSAPSDLEVEGAGERRRSPGSVPVSLPLRQRRELRDWRRPRSRRDRRRTRANRCRSHLSFGSDACSGREPFTGTLFSCLGWLSKPVSPWRSPI